MTWVVSFLLKRPFGPSERFDFHTGVEQRVALQRHGRLRPLEPNKLGGNNSPLMHQLVEGVLAVRSWFPKADLPSFK